MIQADENIKPIEINLDYLGTSDKITLPKVAAFADDLNIITKLSEDNGKIVEIESLKLIFKNFEELTGLSVNLDQTFAFSSINSKLLKMTQDTYKIKNESDNLIRILGHIFKPTDHLNSKPILQKIHQKLTLATIGLKNVPLQGRYLLTNTFITSQATFHITQINKVFKKDTKEMQRLINRYIKAPYSNDSKYKPFSKGGSNVPNLFNIIQAGKITSYKSYLHSGYAYKKDIRKLLINFGLDMKQILNSGIKIQNMFLNLLNHIGLTRLAIIRKITFETIDITRPNHEPILGNLADPNLPKLPKAIRSLKIKSNEFTIRNKT